MKLATLVAGILGIAETEAATLLAMGQSEGLSISETVALFRTEEKPLTFGQIVAAERQFISNHKWLEKRGSKQGKWIERRRKAS